jgi:hypothetical protein
VNYRGWHPFPSSEDVIVSDPSTRSRSDAAATRRWVERLERFAAGNYNVAAFCASEGVSPSNFYLWRRRLARPPALAPNQPAVVPMRVASPPTPATPIELALPSGTVVRFPADARPELLVAVLRGLEERPC